MSWITTVLFLMSASGGGAMQIQNPEANPLALGLYATPEIEQPIKLENQGEIPRWLSGSLYRGAAGTWDSGNYTAEHLFDGFSRNHRFEITDGAVMYRSRNSSDELLDFVAETGLYPGGSFGGDPCKVIFGAFEMTYRDGTNSVGNTSSDSVSVAFAPNFPGLHNVSSEDPFKSLVATTDQNLLQEIDPVTLEPLELFTYQASNPELMNAGRSAAHPAIGVNGELYNYNLDMTSTPPVYKIFRVDSSGFANVITNITDAPIAYIHSLFSTENYLLLVVWQADIDISKLDTYYNVLDTLKPWDPERKTVFYVIDKKSGTVTSKYTADTFFAFHQVNSFEDPETNSIVIDLPAFPNYEFLEAARIENLRRNIGRRNATAAIDLPTNFHRYRLQDYTKGSRTANGTLKAQPAVLDFELGYKNGNIELPRINDAYHGKPYQFAYGVHIEEKGHFCDSIIKVDVKTKKTSIWKPKTDHMPSEPIFVARPGARTEDDGVLLTMALDAEHRHSSLIIIDAKNMKELARADMPLVVGYGFHGAWAH